MHEDLLERRLRAALRAEGDGLPFTITADELRRRMLLRRRARIGRAGGVLLAAAVGVGLVGVGAIAGGWLDRRDAAPSVAPSFPVAVASPDAPGSTESAGPPTLPSLDELIARGDPAGVVLAQAAGPALGPEPLGAGLVVDPPISSLGWLHDPGEYEIAMACLNSGGANLRVVYPRLLGTPLDTEVSCDGSIATRQVSLGGDATVTVRLQDQGSWRLVVRRVDGAVTSTASGEPALPSGDPAADVFLTADDQTIDGVPGDTALERVLAGSMPTRESYLVRVACVGTPSMRFTIGDDSQGQPFDAILTQVPCDGVAHRAQLPSAWPFPSRVFVTAAAGTRFVLEASGDRPPIELTQAQPGWQLSSGIGPNLQFDDFEQGVSLVAGETAGPVRVVFTCSGPEVAHVHADVGKKLGQTIVDYDVDCTAGASVGRTFELPAGNVHVTYETAAQTWVAVAALIPDPSTAP